MSKHQTSLRSTIGSTQQPQDISAGQTSMPFFSPETVASRRSNLGRGVNVRGPLTHDSGARCLPT